MDEHLAELLAAATVEIAAQRNITLEEIAMFVRERFRRLRATSLSDDGAEALAWRQRSACDLPAARRNF
jgi:hypothetical protein